MYRNLKTLIVFQLEELDIPKRVKKLYWQSQWGNIITVIISGISGIILSCLGLALAIIGLTPRKWLNNQIFLEFKHTSIFWPLFLGSTFFAALLLWWADGFLKEVKYSPFPGFLKEPDNYRITEGKIEKFNFIYGDKRYTKILAVGKYLNTITNREQTIIEHFSLGCWKCLKKQKLPMSVFIVYNTKTPYNGVLFGIPGKK